jgi:ankyrin repeat protein
MLLNKGADFNAQEGYYGNNLHAASYSGYEKVVQRLLDRGADVNAQTDDYVLVLGSRDPRRPSLGRHNLPLLARLCSYT